MVPIFWECFILKMNDKNLFGMHWAREKSREIERGARDFIDVHVGENMLVKIVFLYSLS